MWKPWTRKLLTINLTVDSVHLTNHILTHFPKLRLYLWLAKLKRNGHKVKIISTNTRCENGKPRL